MIRRFRIEDAKACTEICRDILLWAAPSSPYELADPVRALTSLDALTAGTALLVRRLRPLDDADATRLIDARVAMASLREDLTSGEVSPIPHV